jgi:hypothetical protein
MMPIGVITMRRSRCSRWPESAGHYESAFSQAKPTLDAWLAQGASDARELALFWETTFQADP